MSAMQLRAFTSACPSSTKMLSWKSHLPQRFTSQSLLLRMPCGTSTNLEFTSHPASKSHELLLPRRERMPGLRLWPHQRPRVGIFLVQELVQSRLQSPDRGFGYTRRTPRVKHRKQRHIHSKVAASPRSIVATIQKRPQTHDARCPTSELSPHNAFG